MIQPLSLRFFGEPVALGPWGYFPANGRREVGRLNSPAATSVEALPGVFSVGELNQPEDRYIDQVDGADTCLAPRGRVLAPCRGDMDVPP